MIKRILCSVICAVVVLPVIGQQKEASSIEEAFKNGTVKGTIGSYYEYTDTKAVNADFGWATAYAYLKFETASWNRLNLGIGYHSHTQVWNWHDHNAADGYDADVPNKNVLAEYYLKYALTDKSSFTLGRWRIAPISHHLERQQAEGAYFHIGDLPNTDWYIGAYYRYAEADFDDGKDFTIWDQTKNSYGDYICFTEAKIKMADEQVLLNPYVIHQEEVCTLYGTDLDIALKMSGDIKVGASVDYYFIDSYMAGQDDGDAYAIRPFISVGPVTLTLTHQKFDDSSSMINPPTGWLNDFMDGITDQHAHYRQPDDEIYGGRVKVKLGDGWASCAYEESTYEFSAGRGDGTRELEVRGGYNFSKAFSGTISYYNIEFLNVNNVDYQKVEGTFAYKF